MRQRERERERGNRWCITAKLDVPVDIDSIVHPKMQFFLFMKYVSIQEI